MICWKRVFETPTSAQFIATGNGINLAAVEIHYLNGGSIAGTAILLGPNAWRDADIPKLLQALSREYQRTRSRAHGSACFTIVRGTVVAHHLEIW